MRRGRRGREEEEFDAGVRPSILAMEDAAIYEFHSGQGVPQRTIE